MLKDYMEDFVLMARSGGRDGLGGENYLLGQGETFRGAMARGGGRMEAIGGRRQLMADHLLMHETTVLLQPCDQVLRVKDESLWRVTGESSAARAPDLSDLRVAQVTLERLVIPW